MDAFTDECLSVYGVWGFFSWKTSEDVTRPLRRHWEGKG